tara:strand:+ start:219 stop:1127 length:909 start_codon:yes stop_codon:yes gene_type:complete
MPEYLITATEKLYYEGADATQHSGDESYGNYQFISIGNIVNDFIATYCTDGKILEGTKKGDVNYHAMRAMQELSYDTFNSSKAIEVEIPPSLIIPLPQDYVNYVKLTWVDGNGIERILYPARKTSNPKSMTQDANYHFTYDSGGATTEASESFAWTYYKNPVNTTNYPQVEDYKDGFWDMALGGRYGLDPQYAQSNGSYYIDQRKGLIHFSSSNVGKYVTLKYISDGVGSAEDLFCPKFAQEAIIKWITVGCLEARVDSSEAMIARFKKEKYAETRKAKIRLSNVKIEELRQIMRGAGKIID